MSVDYRMATNVLRDLLRRWLVKFCCFREINVCSLSTIRRYLNLLFEALGKYLTELRWQILYSQLLLRKMHPQYRKWNDFENIDYFLNIYCPCVIFGESTLKEIVMLYLWSLKLNRRNSLLSACMIDRYVYFIFKIIVYLCTISRRFVRPLKQFGEECGVSLIKHNILF